MNRPLIVCSAALLAIAGLLESKSLAQDVTQRQHVVTLSADGLVAGRVVAIDAPSRKLAPLSELDIQFVQGGSIIQSTKTDTAGKFIVDGLAPGAYSFVATSPKGFVAYGLYVQPYEANEDGEQGDIVAAAVSPRFIALRQIVDRYLPRRSSVLQTESEIGAAILPSDVSGGWNQVLLNDGKLAGTVQSLIAAQKLEETRVFLIQNDETLAETSVDAQGEFEFEAVEPGVYDFVAVGSAGMAAISFEAVVADLTQESAENDQEADAGQEEQEEEIKPAERLETVLTPSDDTQVVAEEVTAVQESVGDVAVSQEFDPYADPLGACGDVIGCGAAAGACGCGMQSDYFGGGGGSCGGSGWFGGFGGIAEALIAGWVITEIINDDDNGGNPPPPIPISPHKKSK